LQIYAIANIYCRRIIPITPAVASVATDCLEAHASASGSSSANDIQIIAPAANHSPIGITEENFSTNKNAGTAIKGCGRLVKILHSPAFHRDTPRGTITELIASPSGIFWIAIATVI